MTFLSNYVVIGDFNLTYIDLIVACILLISFFVGVSLGFVRQFFSLVGGLLSIALAWAFCKPLSTMIADKVPAVTETLEGWFADLTADKIPPFLKTLFESLMQEGVSIQQLFAKWVLIVACFLIIFIIAKIAFSLLKKFFVFIVEHLALINGVDKLLGGVLNLIKMIVVLALVMVAINMIGIDISKYLAPVTEEGEVVTCYFNEFLTKIMNSSLIKNALTSILSLV